MAGIIRTQDRQSGLQILQTGGRIPRINRADALPADPHFSNVSLLLQPFGADGSTTFLDASRGRIELTAGGNAQIDTGVLSMGTSVLLDGAGDALTFPISNLFNFPGDFTIELFVYLTSIATYAPMYEARAGASLSQSVFGIYKIGGSNRLDFVYNSARLTGTSVSVALNTRTHVAVTRSGATLRVFTGGTVDATTATLSGAVNMAGATGYIGASVDPLYFNGNIGQVRVTKGVARYTASFTPPAAFPLR